MRLIYLAIVVGALVTGCAKKAPATAKTTPSNTDSGAATAPAAPAGSESAPAEGGGTRAPVKKGGDPCDGGQ